jgi:hypothetical protein
MPMPRAPTRAPARGLPWGPEAGPAHAKGRRPARSDAGVTRARILLSRSQAVVVRSRARLTAPFPRAPPPHFLVPSQARGGSPQPVWEWFCLSNIVAVLVFLSCVTYLLPFWVEHMRTGGGHFSVAQPAFIASAVGALGSLLYFFAFFGVAFVHQDVKEIMRGEDVARRAAQRRAAGGQNGPASSAAAEGDADVVIVGMGIAGATLATVLARQGKRVVVLERCVGGGDGVRARRVGYRPPQHFSVVLPSPHPLPPLPPSPLTQRQGA